MSTFADHLAAPARRLTARRSGRPGPAGFAGRTAAGSIRPGAALATAAVVAAAAWPLGSMVPLVGAPLMGLILGLAVAAVAPLGRLRAHLGLVSRYALQVAIVLLGATIDLQRVVSVGTSSVPVMLGSLASSLLAAWVLGRRLGVERNLRVLVGVGTGICGASAIAAVSGVIDAREREIRYAISTIFAFNLAAVLLFPALGHLLGLGQHAFGLWAGTAVNDTSSVVAAGFAYGHAAGAYAVIVKLTRTTMIVPICLVLGAVTARRRRSAAPPSAGDLGGPAPRRSRRRIVPWFLLAFVAASAVNTLGGVGAGAHAALSPLALALTTVALAAVGLSSDFGEMRRTGARPLVLGALVWATVATTSIALQALTGGA